MFIFHEFRSFPENAKKILWDNSVTDKEIFIVLDADNVLHTFIVYPDDVEEGGLSCVNLGTTKVTNSKFLWLEKFFYKKNCFVNSISNSIRFMLKFTFAFLC